jgi:hypothetical protein
MRRFVLAVLTVAASLALAVPATAAGAQPASASERAVQRAVSSAYASGHGTVSRATIERHVRASVALFNRQSAALGREPGRRVLSTWGYNNYCPAASWVNNGNTVVACFAYVVESLTGGCRAGVFTTGTLNGNPWSLDYRLHTPQLKYAGGSLADEKAKDYDRYGDGYVAWAVADGLFTNGSAQAIYGDNVWMGAKGASEGTYHTHTGTSHNATLWCH